MLPTSSSTDLVGRNARSATALINGSASSQGYWRLPTLRLAQRTQGVDLTTNAGACNSPSQLTVPGARRPAFARAGWWYVPPALSAWRTRSCGIVAGVGMALGPVGLRRRASNQAAREPQREVPGRGEHRQRSRPSQQLAQHTHLVIAVRNAGHKAIPNVAVTICNVTCAYPAPKGEGTSAQAFAARHRPARTWPTRRGRSGSSTAAPGPCGYSCQNGGQGGAVTAYSNTWALGRLAPGHSARFDWAVTAVAPGKHVVAWEVAAGLNGKAKAVLPTAPAQGLRVTSTAPRSPTSTTTAVVTSSSRARRGPAQRSDVNGARVRQRRPAAVGRRPASPTGQRA